MIQWETDRRAASLVTRVYVRGMRWRRDKQAFEGAAHTVARARRLQRRGDAPPTLLTRLQGRVSWRRAGTMDTWRVGPRRTEPSARVLYLHGGGYVHPLTADYWRLVRALVRAPAEVIVVAYPLAPEATIDDVLPQLVELYDHATTAGPAVPVLLMGDSAGGALALAMAQELRRGDLPPPASLVLLSPWVDATLRGPEIARLETTDPMLAESGLRAAGRRWAGPHGPGHPLVSPINADLQGLPPLEIHIGDHDILRPGVDTLVDRAHRAGVDVHVHEVTAMFHVWMTRAIPEGRRSRLALVESVRRVAGRYPARHTPRGPEPGPSRRPRVRRI